MTTARAVGAVSREAAEWYAIHWPAIHRNVRRLQVRIVKATKERRWGRVRALQRLLTHSYSGKVLAVRRVTENNGKATPGVDHEIWNTPEKKIQAVRALSVGVIDLNLCGGSIYSSRMARRCGHSEFPQ